MRKLLFSPVLLLALNAFGQAAPPPPQTQAPIMPEFIVPVQIGTDTLKNGKVTVVLTPEALDEMKEGMALPDYVVMLTPKGECGQISLGETTANSFVVREQKGSGSSSGMFQYVVYVKQRRPQRPGRPMPPMRPQPGQPQPPAAPVPQGH